MIVFGDDLQNLQILATYTTCLSYSAWWGFWRQIVSLFLLLGNFPAVSPAINNKYLRFFIPEYTKRFIYLEGKFSYSLQLVLHKGDAQFGNLTATSNASLFTPTEFIIKAPEVSYYSIIAVIQNLHLRTNPFTIQGQSCRDFIQFSVGEGDSSNKSSKICGKLERENTQSDPSGLIGPRIFFSPQGSLKLRVHVDSAVSLHDFNELNSIGAEIVFTAYTECPGTGMGLTTLKRCSDLETLSCIPAALFCDSKIDCGFPDGFGRDEDGCYFPYLYAGVAATIIFLVILFIYLFMRWVRLKAKRNAATAGVAYGSTTSNEGEGDVAAACESVDMDASMGAF